MKLLHKSWTPACVRWTVSTSKINWLRYIVACFSYIARKKGFFIAYNRCMYTLEVRVLVNVCEKEWQENGTHIHCVVKGV